MNEWFLYDCRGLVCRTTSLKVLKACAKQILKGISILSWYSHQSPGGTYFDYRTFEESIES